MKEALEHKTVRYTHLAATAEERGWRVEVRPVVVGCKGFVASSTPRLLREVGLTGLAHRKTLNSLIHLQNTYTKTPSHINVRVKIQAIKKI